MCGRCLTQKKLSMEVPTSHTSHRSAKTPTIYSAEISPQALFPCVSLTQEASVPPPTPTVPSPVTRVCGNLSTRPKRRSWNILLLGTMQMLSRSLTDFHSAITCPPRKDRPSRTLRYNWPVTLTWSREALVKPWEDAWRAIFSPGWVNIWSWLVRKQVHQGRQPQVQRRSRDVCLEGFMGSDPQVRRTCWLGPSVHPSKPAPVLTQSDKGANEGSFPEGRPREPPYPFTLWVL